MKVLVVDDDPSNIFAMTTLLERGDAQVIAASSGPEALAALGHTADVDLILMDIMMPVMDGYQTIRAIRTMDRFQTVPIIAVTCKVEQGERQRCVDAGATDYVPKPVHSMDFLDAMERLHPLDGTDATAAAIPTSVAPAPAPAPSSGSTDTPVAEKPGWLTHERGRRAADHAEGTLKGVRILLVDDDFRNIFAMTALLERGEAVVTVAESGSEALAVLEGHLEIDIVLMDIMMPIMDGYETIRAIRAIAHFEDLPIIAVTGKASAGERQRCVDAGANDYIPKPVDSAELLAALRPWLPTTTRPAT